MITKMSTQAVYVSDQKAAEKFWTDQVGFVVTAKNDMGNGSFWLEVAPKGAQTKIVLYPKALMKDWEKMNPSIVFECDDVDTTYRHLKERGVNAGKEPNQMQWGKFSSFKDADGNEFLIKSVRAATV
jgi:lactoylglutathione lyase